MNAGNLLCVCLATILPVATAISQAHGGEQAKDPIPGVQVKLAIPGDAYDPSTPSDKTVRCSVVNKSTDPVEVSVGYDGRTNVLQAKGDHLRWEMSLYPFERSEGKLQPTNLKPGEEKVLFELPLDGILLQRPIPQDKRTWRWDWIARPEAPFSPIYRKRREGLVDKVTFYAKTLVNGKQLSSEEVVLKVVTSGVKEKPIRSD